MARIKYYYDTETCKYERVKVSSWDVALNLLGFFSVSMIIAIAIVIIYSTYFESPKEALLKKENQELSLYYDILHKQITDLNEMMQYLQTRDDKVYRVIFEAEPIPNTIRRAGVGGTDRYKDLLESKLEKEDLIVNTFKKIDQLKKQMYIQTKSYDEIVQMAKNKDKMWASIPAIQPISNKELNRLASGYGMRIHPIYKTRRMHTGIDFSAPRGTPIYATGDGVVKVVRDNGLSGYGKEVVVDHGYGYKTRYAHLDKFNIKRGQKIKRGECIGYVGSTGTSTAPHCHYEVIKDGKAVDPVHYFFQDLNADEYQKILELASIENQSLS
ncbi:MAG: M23 family metallopeptidase [Candidatus Cyclobacteriaceae bacterium M3_2C_046]